MSRDWDVVVVGAGNAAMCAAHAAHERGSSVLVLEKAPEAWSGGNSYFTAGGFRFPHRGLAELGELMCGPAEASVDIPPYTEEEFARDLLRLTADRVDRELLDVLVAEANSTVKWLKEQGLVFRLMTERQAFHYEGRMRFWGGVALGTVDAGKGLVAQHFAAARRSGVELRFGVRVEYLVRDADGICGVRTSDSEEIRCRAVVLASGGFEADPRLRAAYLGPGWDLAKVRGTPFNTGDGHRMAIDVGAQAYGNWSGCHSVAWDLNAPPIGDREKTNSFTRGSYPLGIVINRDGKRFIDEGADFRVYTYARYGADILHQPGSVAFQIFDAETIPLLRQDEYTLPGTTVVEADSMEELAQHLHVDKASFQSTVDAFNKGVQPGKFDPVVLDGKSTGGVNPPKSNWALPISKAPFVAYPVTCGITFTFGGLRIDAEACVLNAAGERIRNLFAAGEIVGGLFYENYPGGAGLTSGAVFGRRAGASAAEGAAQKRGQA